MRIGIYGGSFDPVHYGHVNVARTAVADLSLDKLLVVPAAVSPFKTDAGPGAGPWQRLEMVKAAFADVSNAVVDMREVERGGVSYAIDTVRSIVAETPPSDAGNEFFFIIGEDSLDRLDEWKDIDELRRLCTFKAYPRTKESSSEIRRLFAQKRILPVPPAEAAGVLLPLRRIQGAACRSVFPRALPLQALPQALMRPGNLPSAAQCRRHEAAEQRVRGGRARLELRMKLAGYEEGVPGQLHHFDELAVRRKPAYPEAGCFQLSARLAVVGQLVAVAVAF